MDRKKVLIVDDELTIRRLVRSTLSTDYTILEAGNGEEAISITRTEKPALILMDIFMPKLDGYTACHAIKTDSAIKDVPVVMLTGAGYQLNRKLGQNMGAADYITKPFELQELRDKVKQHELAPYLVG
jgi:DNA-binding response OmpR family regulator